MISMAFRKMDLTDFVWVSMRNCFLHIVFSAKEQTYLCFIGPEEMIVICLHREIVLPSAR